MQDTLQQLTALGLLDLPSPSYLFGLVVFGLIGMMAYSSGGKKSNSKIKWMGISLMFYPYAVSQTWALYSVGVLLCVGLFLSYRSESN